MKTVEDYEAIRRAYFIEKQSIRPVNRRSEVRGRLSARRGAGRPTNSGAGALTPLSNK